MRKGGCIMRIGDNIRNARVALKLSQDELAERVGVSRVTVSKYENGRFLPSVPALEKLAFALGTTPAILTEQERPTETPEYTELVALARKSDPAAIRAASAVLRALIADNEETKKA